jgi:hypothetical protein
MREGNLTLERRYEPDEDAMVGALMIIMRAKGPPGQTEIKETADPSLQATPTVSPRTTRPGTGGSRV